MGAKSRVGKTDRVPKTRAGNTWTEDSFIGFIRSGLRKLSRRWPPRAEAMKVGRRKNQSSNRRLKFEHQCVVCLGWFPEKGMQLDHIVPCGEFTSLDQIQAYVERLFVEIDGFRKLCRKCNRELGKETQRSIREARKLRAGVVRKD